MVARLAACLEEQVKGDVIAASEAVVQVEAGARHVEADVVRHECLRRLGLKEARALLLVDPEVPNEVAVHGRVAWEVTFGSIGAGANWLEWVCPVRVAPQRDGSRTSAEDGVVRNVSISVESAQHDRVAVKPDEVASFNGRVHRPFQEERR